MRLREGFGCALLALAVATPAAAQQADTRLEILARQRAEKASQLRPYVPGKIEKALLWVEQTNPIVKIAPFNGFFVMYGYTGKPTGSGLAVGGGWRSDLFDRRARLELEIGQSLRNYRMARADLSLPRLADGRIELGFTGGYRHQPQDDFYGLGFDSQRGDRTNYEFHAPEIQGRALLKPTPWLITGVRAGRMNVSVGSGTDSRYPSTEQRFTEAEAPGLSRQPDYTYTDVLATIDTRDQPGNPRDGLYINAFWRQYNDSDLDRYNFDGLEFEVRHFLPVFDKKRVFAARFLLQSTRPDDGQEVPFYFQPTLGGNDTLRSSADFRFRDRHVVLANFEYRWEAFSGLDMALFSDFGTTAPTFRRLEFSGLRGAYGIGLRFNTYKAVWLRLDFAAGGSEGFRTFLKYSRPF